MAQTRPDILVIGRSGQLARALEAALAGRDAAPVLLGRPDLDLEDADAISDAIDRLKPRLVINAAAYTAVDAAETDRETAFHVNGTAAGLLAGACAATGASLVHVSTDFVFGGQGDGPFRETDEPAPVNVYGASKRAGELAVLAACPAAVIVRTSWVFGPTGRNFAATMLRLAASRDAVGVVDDQRGCPTYAPDLAAACLALGEAMASDPKACGVWHFANVGEASWADLAEAVFEASRKRGGPSARVERITTRDYPTPARRPADSRLDIGRYAGAFGAPVDWRARVDQAVAGLLRDG